MQGLGAGAAVGVVVFDALALDQFLDALGMVSLDELPDIAPYLPEDADLEEFGADETEVLATVEDGMSPEDD